MGCDNVLLSPRPSLSEDAAGRDCTPQGLPTTIGLPTAERNPAAETAAPSPGVWA